MTAMAVQSSIGPAGGAGRSRPKLGQSLRRAFGGARAAEVAPAPADPRLEATLEGLKAISDRLDALETAAAERAERIEAELTRIKAQQAESAWRVQAAEQDGGASRVESLRGLEQALDRLAARIDREPSQALAEDIQALEARLSRSEQSRTETLARLGEQIGRLAGGLSERIAAVEQRVPGPPEPELHLGEPRPPSAPQPRRRARAFEGPAGLGGMAAVFFAAACFAMAAGAYYGALHSRGWAASEPARAADLAFLAPRG
jgi:hypothetical protein